MPHVNLTLTLTPAELRALQNAVAATMRHSDLRAGIEIKLDAALDQLDDAVPSARASSTIEVDVTRGAAELLFGDLRLRLRWEQPEDGVKLTAEEIGGRAATDLVVLPRSANGVVLQVR